jgi:hypothetical protein
LVANVIPGEYTMTVSPSADTPNATREYARVMVRVTGDDIKGLVVTTSKGSTVRGRLVFEGGELPKGVRPFSMPPTIRTSPAHAASGGLRTFAEDWSFTLAGSLGTGVIRFLDPGIERSTGWYLKSVTLGGRDITDTPIDFGGDREFNDLQVVMTRRRAGVRGVVVDETNAPVNDYVAVLFSQDPNLWKPFNRHTAAARPDQQGGFQIQGMPPGRYLMAAVDYLEPGGEQDPSLLGRLRERAMPITLEEGENTPVRVRIIEY